MTGRAAPRFSEVLQCRDISNRRIRDLACSSYPSQRTLTWGLQGLFIKSSDKNHGRDPNEGREVHLPRRNAESHHKLKKEPRQKEVESVAKRALEERNMDTEGQKVS